MRIDIYPNEFVIRDAVGGAISAVLGNIHNLPHGKSVDDATNDAVATIMAKGWTF